MDKNILNKFDELRINLELPYEIIQKSIQLYQKAIQNNLDKEHSKATLVISCIHMACNQLHFSRTLTVIAKISKTDILQIATCYHDLVIELNLKPIFFIGKITDREIRQLASALEIPQDLVSNAIILYEKCDKRKIHRGPPVPMIAACLYAVCRNTLTPKNLKEIAQGTQTSRKDVARCYRKIIHEFSSHKQFYSDS